MQYKIKKNNKFTNKKQNLIRIIGGKYKKSPISVLNIHELRPTSNYMRETLFNWISKEKIKTSHCLDCFSGSGALGLEAVSRHALSSTCIEIHKQAVYLLKNTLTKLKIDNVNVVHADTITWLKKPQKSYDLIFLDPPFNTTLLSKTIILLTKHHWIKKNALIYIEREKTSKKLYIPNNWILKKKKKKNVNYFLYLNIHKS